MVCAKAIDPVQIPNAFSVLDNILSRYEYSGPLVTGIAQIVRGWATDMDTISLAQATVSSIVARAQKRDDSWFMLASNALGIPEATLRDYTGDSPSLAIFIHVVRQQFSHFHKSSWPKYEFSFVLEAASKFNVQDTSPGLQNDFCALWNQMVRKVQNDDDQRMAFQILGPIRNVYVALHQDTDCAPTRFSPSTGDWDDILWHPSSYPVCNVSGHHPDSTPYARDDSDSTTFARAVPHGGDNTVLVSSFLSGGPAATSTPTHPPPRFDESLTDAPLPDDNISSPLLETSSENRHIPASSLNVVSSRAIHGSIDASPSLKKTILSTPEPSASLPSSKLKASAPSPDVIAVEHTAVSHNASGNLNIPSSASPAPVLDDILPEGLKVCCYFRLCLD